MVRRILRKIKRTLFPTTIPQTNGKYIQVDVLYRESHGREVNYNSDGLVVFNNCDCLDEERFKYAYTQSLSVDDWRGLDGSKMDMRWRYYMVCWFANHAKNLSGDFVECGVYKGGYSLAIMHYIQFKQTQKTFYLMDTFEGLSPKYVSEEEKKAGLSAIYSGYEPGYEAVVKTFDGYRAEIIKGAVPETLPLCKAEQICFLSIDMNCVEPEIAAANYFWDKLVPGAVVMLDDYGFKAHIQQKLAFDQFAKEKGVSILSLPTGQAVIFKN